LERRRVGLDSGGKCGNRCSATWFWSTAWQLLPSRQAMTMGWTIWCSNEVSCKGEREFW